MQGKIELNITIDPDSLALEVMRQGVYDTFTDALLDETDKLQQESYRGATLDLAASWDVSVEQPSSHRINGSITNDAKAAGNRIAGRGSGKMPYIGNGGREGLLPWVIAKGIETDPKRARGRAIAIGISIARRGTERHRTKDNFLGLNPDGTFKPNDRIEQIENAIASKLAKI